MTVGRTGVDQLSVVSECENLISVSASGRLLSFELCHYFKLCNKRSVSCINIRIQEKQKKKPLNI
jgi:hypothetical protein